MEFFSFFYRKKNLGGGTVLDMGVYAIQFCQWIYQQPPKSISATGTINDDGVDLDMSAEINYGDNKIGMIRSSGLIALSRNSRIVGTKGEITVGTHGIKLKNYLKCSEHIQSINEFKKFFFDIFYSSKTSTLRLQLLILMEVKKHGHYRKPSIVSISVIAVDCDTRQMKFENAFVKAKLKAN